MTKAEFEVKYAALMATGEAMRKAGLYQQGVDAVCMARQLRKEYEALEDADEWTDHTMRQGERGIFG